MKPKMEKIKCNHINYSNPKGEVYCRWLNKTWKLNFEKCDKCPYLSGGAQGAGVECYYEDVVSKTQQLPLQEKMNDALLRISDLIDEGKIEKRPK